MPMDREALLRHYEEMRRDLIAAIEGIADEHLVAPTLDGWSVKDHLAHLASWDEIRAAEVQRISAGHESAWRMNGEQDAVFNDWETDSSHRRLLDAIADATPRGLDGSLYGEAGLLSRHEVQHTGWITRWRTEQGL
jgi:uncharacterized damage-inducible protein DinB